MVVVGILVSLVGIVGLINPAYQKNAVVEAMIRRAPTMERDSI